MPHRLARAMAYPYPIPKTSFRLHAGGIEDLAEGNAHREGRIPVVASGSNRSPVQLGRKFGADPLGVPVERAWLAGFDVVYAAHITRYGSIPATLHAEPGMQVEVSVIWLTDAQLDVMHATEGNYDFRYLDRLALETDSGDPLDAAYAYIARNGAITRDGAVIGLAEASARGRPHAALDQEEAQALAHAQVGAGGTLDAFILENIEDDYLRARRSQRLGESAAHFTYTHGPKH